MGWVAASILVAMVAIFVVIIRMAINASRRGEGG